MNESLTVLAGRRRAPGAGSGALGRSGPGSRTHAARADLDIRSWALGRSRWVVAVRGELDISDAEAVEETLSASALAGAEAVVVDLRGLTFLGVAGLRALENGCRRCGGAGSRTSILLSRGGAPARLVQLLLGTTERETGVLAGTSIHLMAD